MIFLIFLLIIFFVFLLSAVVYYVLNFLQKRRINFLLKTSFLIKIRKKSLVSGQEGDYGEEINLFEQFLDKLVSLKSTFVLEIAVLHIGKEARFYLIVPRKYAEIVSEQIKSLYGSDSIEPVSGDYNIFHPQGAVAAAYFLQKDNYALPLRSHREININSPVSIFDELSRIKELGEGAAFQLLVRLATGKKTLKSLIDKTTRPFFEVNARLVVSAVSPFQANDVLNNLTKVFIQLDNKDEKFSIAKPRNLQNLIRQFSFRLFDDRSLISFSRN